MSHICGIYRLDKQGDIKKELEKMMDALNYWEPDKVSLEHENDSGFGHLMLYNTPESLAETLPYREDNLIITADARIDNRQEIMHQLDIPKNTGKNIPDSHLILKAYKKWGPHCPVHLSGDFAFAIWNCKTKHMFCARDPMGVKPFYYFLNQHLFLFASEMKGILAHPRVRTTMNEQWIADSLSAIKSGKDKTFYNEVYRLPPAHYLVLSKSKKVIKKYWDLSPKKTISFKNDEEYTEAFKEKLYTAVQNRLRSHYPLGAELSGGLDSSTIVSIAVNQLQYKMLNTFSHALPQNIHTNDYPFSDEREYIDKLIGYCNLENHHYITNREKGIIPAMEKSLSLQDAPTQQNFHLFSGTLYNEVGKQGVRTLLSGFGGDELVTSRMPGYLQDLANKGKWGKYMRELMYQRKIHDSPVIKPFASNIINKYGAFMAPLLKILFSKKEDWLENKFNGFAINPGFIEKMNIKKHFWDSMKYPERDDIRERQHDRITHNHISQRLEYSYIAAHSRKIDYRYPYFDKDLMEFYLALPLHCKVYKGWTRYITRKATEGIMPDEVRWRRDKRYVPIPIIYQRLLDDEQTIQELITGMQTSESLDYIDYDKMQEWFVRIKARETNSSIPLNTGAFYNSLMLLLFQKNTLSS